ncbi:hypothetical protein RU97_GL000465 [Enterococcus canis]|uniref:DUF3284 domain-containing protein n=1 Tax=Enterococcus canis TaxID=214095 RepID=A0A1L8RKL5_9ENTE|nr:DUF3284 domain-containing protein [Enterococcus canis]OJG20232.1 hypothetical protein RU97_GL000465 [Enterococcus canis]
MEIVKEMNVPATFFFDKVTDSVLYDIQKQTGKAVNKKQLNNFEYVKEFSQNSRAKITIEKFVENEAYHFRTSTTRNDFLVEYDVKRIDDRRCQVRYRETMKSYGFMQQMNDMVLGVVVGFLRKRRFKKMLQMIETSY